jgi:S-adenosylmethionine hydrolase
MVSGNAPVSNGQGEVKRLDQQVQVRMIDHSIPQKDMMAKANSFVLSTKKKTLIFYKYM